MDDDALEAVEGTVVAGANPWTVDAVNRSKAVVARRVIVGFERIDKGDVKAKEGTEKIMSSFGKVRRGKTPLFEHRSPLVESFVCNLFRTTDLIS